MQNYLYRNNRKMIPEDRKYPITCEIDSEESMKEAVSYDHIAANLNGRKRCSENYNSSNILMMDFDNDNTNDPTEWITIEDFMERYRDYKFYIATSKSHNTQKKRTDGKVKPTDSSRPRFHAYFILDKDLTEETYPSPLKIQKYFEVVDRRALDRARLFYGNPSSKIYFNEGNGKDIIESIDSVEITREQRNVVSNFDELSELTKRGKKEVLFYLEYLSEHDFFDEYDTWFALGAALKSSGFSYNDWMSLSWSGEDTATNEKRWEQFKVGKITLGTIIYWIRNNVPGKYLWTPDTNSFIDYDESDPKDQKKYQVVDLNQFIMDLNRKWVKTINSRGLVIRNTEENQEYIPKAVEHLYSEYIFRDGDEFKRAYPEWFKGSPVAEKIKRSGEKEGLILEDGVKVFYIKDEKIKKNFLPNLSNQVIEDTYYKNLNNNIPYVQSSYHQIGKALNKGFQPGYVYCFSALTGIGKTWFLLNEAVNLSTNLTGNLAGKYKVLYISTEMDFDKIFPRISGIYYNQSNLDKAHIQFNKDLKNGNNILENFGFYFVDRGMNTDLLLEEIEQGDFDIIFIDYLDDFEPTRRTDVEYKKHRIIAEDFTELAVKLNIPVITATQSNRTDSNEDGSTKKNRGFSSIGDGYQKTHKMAVVWNIVKESDDVSSSYRGLVSQKNRDITHAPDCHFDLIPSGRLVEVNNAPVSSSVSQKLDKEMSKANAVSSFNSFGGNNAVR